MFCTSINLNLFLGRHEGVESGLWVYGRTFLKSLSRCPALMLDGGAALTCHYAGPDALDGDLLEIAACSEIPMTLRKHSSSLPSRRLGFVSDLLGGAIGKCDLLHGTANTMPLSGGKRRVLTLHDVYQAYPPVGCNSLYARMRAVWYRIQLRLLVRSVDLILTDHEKSRDQIEAYFHPGCPIEVVYPALDDGFINAALPECSNASKVFLSFASRDKRKNVERLMAAFARFNREMGSEYELCLVVNNDHTAHELKQKIAAYDQALRCDLKVKVSPKDLPLLYARSRGLLYPSLGEGFGYPIYEALSQGVPVLCSSELPVRQEYESFRAGLVHCDVLSEDFIYEGIKEMLRMPQQLGWRTELSKSVRRLFSGERSAARVVAWYKKLLERNSHE